MTSFTITDSSSSESAGSSSFFSMPSLTGQKEDVCDGLLSSQPVNGALTRKAVELVYEAGRFKLGVEPGWGLQYKVEMHRPRGHTMDNNGFQSHSNVSRL